MTVRSPAGVNLRYRFSSISAAMAATLPPRTSWTVVGSSGVVIAGGVTGATSGPIYPVRTAQLISFADLASDPVGGFNAKSGVVASFAIGAAGAGYVNGETLTLDASAGYFPNGVAATWQVATVGGSGEVLTGALVLAGDYEQTPPETATATTASAAGTGCTLVPTVDNTIGIGEDGSGFLTIEAHRAAGSVSTIQVDLPALNGADGWFELRSAELRYELTTLTQLTASASVDEASFIGLRMHRLGALDTPWVDHGIYQRSAGNWDIGHVDSASAQTVDLVSIPATDGRDFSGEVTVYGNSAVVAAPFVDFSLYDLDVTGRLKVKGSKGWAANTLGWTLGANDDMDVDPIYLSAILHAGPTAGDRLKITLKSLFAAGRGA